MDRVSPDTRSTCSHCKHKSETGTRGGCADCGKVKFTSSGRIPPRATDG